MARRRQREKKRKKKKPPQTSGYQMRVVGDVKSNFPCESKVHVSNCGLSRPGLFTDPGGEKRIPEEEIRCNSTSLKTDRSSTCGHAQTSIDGSSSSSDRSSTYGPDGARDCGHAATPTDGSASSSRTERSSTFGRDEYPDCILCQKEQLSQSDSDDSKDFRESDLDASKDSDSEPLSETGRDEWERLLGQRCLGMLGELFKKSGQRPVLQALMVRLTKPLTKDDIEHPEKNITPSIMAKLLRWNRKRQRRKVRNVMRATIEKWHWLKNRPRMSEKRGSYISPEERNLSLSWLASLGELDSSTANKFKILVSRKEVYRMYLAWGLKSILFSMTKLPKYEAVIKAYREKTTQGTHQESENGGQERGLVPNLVKVDDWAKRNFEGECDINFKRRPKTFWKILKCKIAGSNKQVVKTSFANKMHPCEICLEADETLDVHEDIYQRHEDAKDPKLKTQLKRILDQWAKKIELLKLHKEKHERQRAKVQHLAEQLKDKPGTCIVYEDFCNFYQANMAKMLNLVLVLIYWEGKSLVYEYYDNFCRGSLTLEQMRDVTKRGNQDTYVYKMAWVEAFKAGMFDKFHTIWKTGDNGSALKNYTIVHLHTLLMQEYDIRIAYSTLCPRHAESIADGVGWRSKNTVYEFERRTGNQLWKDAAVCADALNSIKRKNVKKAKAFEAAKVPDKYVPESDKLITSKLDHWPYGIGPCCALFPEVPNIFDNSEHPKETIRLVDVVMIAPTEDHAEGLAVLDLRPETLDREHLCMDCTKRFLRFVLLKEHNQSEYWLCPATHVYTFETKESLKQKCKRCKKIKGEGHRQGADNPCPSKAEDGVIKHRHLSFLAESTVGVKRFRICFPKGEKDKKPVSFTPTDIATLRQKYNIKKQERKVKSEVGDNASALLMIAPGIMMVYKKPEADQKIGGLPWTLARCENTDTDKKVYTVRVFDPSDSDPVLAPLSPWRATEKTAQVKFNSVWVKVGKLSRGKICYKFLRHISEDVRFGWKWITLLDPSGPKEPVEMDDMGEGAEERGDDGDDDDHLDDREPEEEA